MTELRTVRIGGLGRVVTGKTPPSSQPELFGELYPFLTPTDIDGVARYVETTRFLSIEGCDYQHRFMLPARAVCVVCIGATIGKVCMTNRPSFTNQQVNSVIVNENEHDPFFVYHLLATFREELKANAGGAATPIINKTAFSEIEVNVPSLSVQQRIAGILSAYDDLIENNQRRIRILETMASALYREWFVEFRFPGHDKIQRVASSLGDIPQGWEVREMQEIADVIDCLHSKKPAEYHAGPGVLIQLNNIGEAGKLDMRQRFCISASDYALWTSRIELQAGDCVITNVGRVGAIAQIPEGVKAAPGRNITAVRPRAGRLTHTYLIQYLLSSHMTSEVVRKKDLGTIMDSLNVRGIIRLRVPCPPLADMLRFESTARPMRKRVEVLVKQIHNLRRTRDLLLPRLLSGQVALTDTAA